MNLPKTPAVCNPCLTFLRKLGTPWESCGESRVVVDDSLRKSAMDLLDTSESFGGTMWRLLP